MDGPVIRPDSQPGNTAGPSLFPGTSQIAAAASARVSGTRRHQVLELLRKQPLTLWETARALGAACKCWRW